MTLGSSHSTPSLPRLRGVLQSAITEASGAGTRSHELATASPALPPRRDSLPATTESIRTQSKWAQRFEREARGEWLAEDSDELLQRFESSASQPARIRKPLNPSLLTRHATTQSFAGLDDDDNDGASDGVYIINREKSTSDPSQTALPARRTAGTRRDAVTSSNAATVTMPPLVDASLAVEPARMPGAALLKLRMQSTKLILQQRALQNAGGASRNGHSNGKTNGTTRLAAAGEKTAVNVVPKRFLYDGSRWPRTARCEFCQHAGGDLECATCDVIAHAACYLSAFDATPRKTKGAFVVPTRFSWLCPHCQSSLQCEYDERAKQARRDHIVAQQSVFGKVVKAYVRMTRDALLFKKKKDAIVRLQAVIRGRLARDRVNLLRRMRLKPYTIDGFALRGLKRGSHNDELRLANGFTCNPYLYVTVVDGDDDDLQLFCYETSLRRVGPNEQPDVAWPERLFVPGVNGNVTFSFTLLSKNGPNHFVLGQTVLRLKHSECMWRTGVALDLSLATDLEIFPRTAQRQPLRLLEVVPSVATTDAFSFATRQRRDQQQQQRQQQQQQHVQTTLKTTPPPPPVSADPLFANATSDELMLSLRVRPFSDVHSYCGYMTTKASLDSVLTSLRWCVLADGVLRIYRHYGVTLATDTVDLAHTIEIKLIDAKNHHRRGEQWIAMEHMTRLYLLQCERPAATKLWLKKLQAAVRFTGAASNTSNNDNVSTTTNSSSTNSTEKM
ncbi:hypothetical protein PINS_up010278 [Pythium insidiosum]|nr:hypothetical protein PINS_up010278 [Pythium insidiosum]